MTSKRMSTRSTRAPDLLDLVDGEVVFLEDMVEGWSHLGGEEATM